MKILKGNDRQFRVVELSVVLRRNFQDSFETYKMSELCIITEFERIVEVQNYPFGGGTF